MSGLPDAGEPASIVRQRPGQHITTRPVHATNRSLHVETHQLDRRRSRRTEIDVVEAKTVVVPKVENNWYESSTDCVGPPPGKGSVGTEPLYCT
ncbi:hypothetical protein ACFJIW_20415 [Tahibacter sp. UC22_41]|uniref:hypothetical protein n=1 Tax=Tahibacter sp. UC22_41 TaxID=3350178 RepID=UPI0036D7695F